MKNFSVEQENLALIIRAGRLLDEFHGDTLRAGAVLRKEQANISGEILRQALDFSLLRKKAAPQGAWTAGGLFTRQSLEQATSPAVARYHAGHFSDCGLVLEICTGAGFDTAALSGFARNVISLEADADLAEMARHNLAVQGISNAVVINAKAEDLVKSMKNEDDSAFPKNWNISTSLNNHKTDMGVWCDPSRRGADGRRIANPDEYSPPLGWLMSAFSAKKIGIKVAPALTLSALPDGWKREWIGVGTECREQILWRGADAMEGTVTLLDDSGVAEQWIPSGKSCEIPAILSAIRAENSYLIEPHNALIRSGFLAEFFSERGWNFWDKRIAYGIAEQEPPQSPFYTAFHVLAVIPANIRSLQSALSERNWGNRTEFKKRGFSEEPEAIRKKLKLPQSDRFGVVVLTRKDDKHFALLCERKVLG